MSTFTVFVVDDDRVYCDSVRELAHASGMTVETFPTTAAFLSVFDAARRGCILISARVARAGHRSLLWYTSALPLPVIFICDYDDRTQDLRSAKAAGAILIQMPYRGSGLLAAIDEAFRREEVRLQMPS